MVFAFEILWSYATTYMGISNDVLCLILDWYVINTTLSFPVLILKLFKYVGFSIIINK